MPCSCLIFICGDRDRNEPEKSMGYRAGKQFCAQQFWTVEVIEYETNLTVKYTSNNATHLQNIPLL